MEASYANRGAAVLAVCVVAALTPATPAVAAPACSGQRATIVSGDEYVDGGGNDWIVERDPGWFNTKFGNEDIDGGRST
ncbi:MAG: hypothetical protein ABR613_09060 [Actinomycetota bacterium]